MTPIEPIPTTPARWAFHSPSAVLSTSLLLALAGACLGIAAAAAACSSNGPPSDAGSPQDSSGSDGGEGASPAGDAGSDSANAATTFSDAAPVTDAAATIVVRADGSVSAPPTAYGQNYWSWVAQYGGQVHRVEDAAAGMGLNVLRAGGHNNDNNTPEAFTSAQVDLFVSYARSVGAEPILQVPLLLDTDGGRPTPQTAADLVTYANVTKKYGIKYWEIGNEPDLYSDQGDLPAGYTADRYCGDFASFADAMRAVDPSIKILGPELSYKYVAGNDWLTPFMTGCASKVDIVTVHRYPFAAAACTIANAMSDAVSFRATVRRLRQTLNSLGATAAPLAITESNFSYQGDPTLQTGTAALGTFYAGMWVADVTGVALEEGVWTMAFWSLDEGFDTGFFTSDTFGPRPAAYAYELVSKHFGPRILHATTIPTGLSAHASRDDGAQKTIVLLINKTANASTQVVGFDGFTAGLPSRAVALAAYSLTLLEVLDDGRVPAVWVYTKDMADNGQGPAPL
jgi:glycosyl hydrolase family 39 (putative alpha-L-iduronidase)